MIKSHLQIFIDEFIRNGLKPKNVLIWDKKSHSMGDLKKAFGGRYESIIWIPNDDFKFKNGRPQDLISVPRVPPCKLIHPNEKPVELLEFLIKKLLHKTQPSLIASWVQVQRELPA